MKMIALLFLICISSIAWTSSGGWDAGTVIARKYGSLNVDGNIYVDGTIYNATITIGNKSNPMKIAGSATMDPCPTLGKGTIFIGKGGMPCFCNALGVDVSIYDGTTACW